MLQINLLPEEQKVKTRTPSAKNLDKFYFLFPAAVGVFVLIHLVLAGIQVGRVSRVKVLTRRMTVLAPQRRQLESQRLADSDPAKKAIDDFIARNIRWSLKLNRLSRHVPAGVWFTDLTISKKDLVLRGTVVSLEDNAMGAINAFMSSLRNDADFMQGLGPIEPGPLGTRSIGSYSVIDFILTIPLLNTT